MKVFAIGDLHLSGSVDKPMDVFGAKWKDHVSRIRQNWLEGVSEEDIVLLPGDFSWAMHLDEVKADLQFLQELPGIKIMLRGNHDYWWTSVTQVRSLLPENIHVIQNDCFGHGPLQVGGSRGWVCPGSVNFDEAADRKIYDREVGRLALSLSGMPKSGVRIAMMHYPPFNETREPSGFTKLFEQESIQLVVYGHLHGRSCKGAFEGIRNGVEYRLVSADYIDFAPRLLMEL